MELLEKFKNYFGLGELFSKPVVAKYGEQAWTFLNEDLMKVILWIREGLNKGITINTSSQQQRGFRENTSQMVSNKTAQKSIYCSAHVLGKGVDLDVKGMKPEQVRQWVRENIDDCPHAIRLEKDVNWVHIDVCNMSDKKLIEFKAS